MKNIHTHKRTDCYDFVNKLLWFLISESLVETSILFKLEARILDEENGPLVHFRLESEHWSEGRPTLCLNNLNWKLDRIFQIEQNFRLIFLIKGEYGLKLPGNCLSMYIYIYIYNCCVVFSGCSFPSGFSISVSLLLSESLEESTFGSPYSNKLCKKHKKKRKNNSLLLLLLPSRTKFKKILIQIHHHGL